jgi:hypothetical protein
VSSNSVQFSQEQSLHRNQFSLISRTVTSLQPSPPRSQLNNTFVNPLMLSLVAKVLMAFTLVPRKRDITLSY